MTPQARASAMRTAWTHFHIHLEALKAEGYTISGATNRRPTYGTALIKQSVSLTSLLPELSISKTVKETL